MTTFASLFGGGRLADIGALQAGCELIWDVELDSAIAEVGSQLGGQTYIQSVTDMNWEKLEPPDILWASPPCPNFSVAKHNGAETELDKALAQSIVDAIAILKPKAFILENVEAYKKSASLRLIEEALFSMGYWIHREVVNSANFGVPQTRRRLILRAVKGGFVPTLTGQKRWVGWYEAIADLIPSLPESKLAQWQIDRLPEGLGASESFSRAVLVESKNANQQYGDGLRLEHEPSTTVITDSKPSHQPKALLIPSANASSFSVREAHEPSRTVGDTERSGNRPRALIFGTMTASNGEKVSIRSEDEPAMMICTSSDRRLRAMLISGTPNSNGETISFRHDDQPALTVTTSTGDRQSLRALLDNCRVVSMTSRALARFQTMPDWYELPEKNTLACKIIGNGAPCLLAQEIIAPLMDAIALVFDEAHTRV